MSNREIKALIILQGTSITAMSRRIGVSREWVSKVVNGKRSSFRIRKAIARELHKTVDDLWPNGGNKAA